MFTASLVREKIGWSRKLSTGSKGWETKVGFSISKKDENESDLRDQRTSATDQRLAGKKET